MWSPGKDVVIVRVPRKNGGDVHSLLAQQQEHLLHSGRFAKSGAARHIELSRLFQQRGTFRADLRPISGATVDDLDRTSAERLTSTGFASMDIPGDDEGAGWQSLLTRMKRRSWSKRA